MRVTEGARRERHSGKASRAPALVSRVSRLRRLTLSHARGAVYVPSGVAMLFVYYMDKSVF